MLGLGYHVFAYVCPMTCSPQRPTVYETTTTASTTTTTTTISTTTTSISSIKSINVHACFKVDMFIFSKLSYLNSSFHNLNQRSTCVQGCYVSVHITLLENNSSVKK